MGLLISVVVHAANIQDRDGAKILLEGIATWCTHIRLIWADSAYAGKLIAWVKEHIHIDLEIVRRLTGVAGFHVVKRRWVVERTFAWLGTNRRLSKDYERLPEVGEMFIYTVMTRLMAKRLAC